MIGVEAPQAVIGSVQVPVSAVSPVSVAQSAWFSPVNASVQDSISLTAKCTNVGYKAFCMLSDDNEI